MSDSQDERRSFKRILFDGNAQLIQNQQNWPVKVIDISLKGLLLEIADNWQGELNQPYQAHIQLSENVIIQMTVEWKHTHSGHAGFICQKVDIDSITHLRRLLELNLADQALLEREFSALIA
jgi:hypothetical protein